MLSGVGFLLSLILAAGYAYVEFFREGGAFNYNVAVEVFEGTDGVYRNAPP